MTDETNDQREQPKSPVMIYDDGKFRYYGKEGHLHITEDGKDGVTIREQLWKASMLVYEKGYVHYYVPGAKLKGSYPATSGQPGVTDPRIPDKGPIPPGRYILNPSEISKGGIGRELDNLVRDWGKYRVPLHPDGADTFGRGGFFLHGGKTPGSAGCIDIGNHDKDLFPELMKHTEPIIVIVK